MNEYNIQQLYNNNNLLFEKANRDIASMNWWTF